jgi:hypothetical protein
MATEYTKKKKQDPAKKKRSGLAHPPGPYQAGEQYVVRWGADAAREKAGQYEKGQGQLRMLGMTTEKSDYRTNFSDGLEAVYLERDEKGSQGASARTRQHTHVRWAKQKAAKKAKLALSLEAKRGIAKKNYQRRAKPEK